MNSCDHRCFRRRFPSRMGGVSAGWGFDEGVEEEAAADVEGGGGIGEARLTSGGEATGGGMESSPALDASSTGSDLT